MSLSDGGVQATMPVAPVNSSNGNGLGWGGDGAWWIVLFLIFAAFGGWGNGFGFGGGNNGRNSGGVVDGYVLASDFSNIERKIDSVNQGLCDGFYQQAQLVNGTNMAMANGFAQAELSRCNQQAALMQQLNNMAMQAQECCCENRAAIAQVRYDMATQACDRAEHHPRHHRRDELRLPQHRPASDGAGACGEGREDRRAEPAAFRLPAGSIAGGTEQLPCFHASPESQPGLCCRESVLLQQRLQLRLRQLRVTTPHRRAFSWPHENGRPHCRYSIATRRGNRPAAIFNRVKFDAFRKE